MRPTTSADLSRRSGRSSTRSRAQGARRAGAPSARSCSPIGLPVDVERRARPDRRRADALLGLPVGHLGREHVLPRRLVAAASHHPDLVAVHDDRRAAQEVEQVVAEQDALQQLARPMASNAWSRIMRAARPVSWLPRNVAGVGAIPDGAPEVVVVGEPARDAAARRPTPPAKRSSESCSGKSITFGRPRVADVAGELDRVGLEDLAEDLEVLHARPRARRPGSSAARPEEGAVDVLGGVDAEAVDSVAPDPVAVDLREAVHDPAGCSVKRSSRP